VRVLKNRLGTWEEWHSKRWLPRFGEKEGVARRKRIFLYPFDKPTKILVAYYPCLITKIKLSPSLIWRRGEYGKVPSTQSCKGERGWPRKMLSSSGLGKTQELVPLRATRLGGNPAPARLTEKGPATRDLSKEVCPGQQSAGRGCHRERHSLAPGTKKNAPWRKEGKKTRGGRALCEGQTSSKKSGGRGKKLGDAAGTPSLEETISPHTEGTSGKGDTREGISLSPGRSPAPDRCDLLKSRH